MLFGGRSISPSIANSTRNKQQSFRQATKSPIRKEVASFRNETKNNITVTTNNKPKKNKPKESMAILYALQQIHNQLNFNQYDAFAQERILDARKNIDRLLTFYKDQPICPKHNDLLNLYCENQKEIICVSCVYKGNQEHKNHKIKPIESVEKSIDYQIIRLQEKSKSLVSQLSLIQEQIIVMEKDICENFMTISNNSIAVINQTIKQLQMLKEQYDNKLSLSYRRTNTIIRRYNQSLSLMIDTLDSNLQKSSTMKGLSKYLLLKQINKEASLMEELITKYQENKILMDQWKKVMKETEKIVTKKKLDINKNQKDDVYIVTKF